MNSGARDRAALQTRIALLQTKLRTELEHASRSTASNSTRFAKRR